MDVEYLTAVFFEFPMPDDVAFPLLMSKFVEAICNPSRVQRSGVPGLVCEMRILDTVPVEDLHAGSHQHADPPLEELLAFKGLEKSAFRRLCTVLDVGLPSGEVDLLFKYLAVPEVEVAPLRVLFDEVVLRLPTAPTNEILDVLRIVRRCVVMGGSNPHGLNDLHDVLQQHGNRPIPMIACLDALRQTGRVAASAVPDVMLDYLRRAAPTCVAMVSLIRGPFPPGRSELCTKLFRMLDPDGTGEVLKSAVLARFEPERVECLLPHPGVWSQRLAQYLDHLHAEPLTAGGEGDDTQHADGWQEGGGAAALPSSRHDSLSLDEFLYYWGNLSAGVDDDAIFTMVLWKGFSMHLGASGRTRKRGGGAHRDGCDGDTGTGLIGGGGSPSPSADVRRRPTVRRMLQ